MKLRLLIMATFMALALISFSSCGDDQTADDAKKEAKEDKSAKKATKDGKAVAKAEAKPTGPTRIEVKEMEFNAGDINRGDDAKHTFILKNISKDVVHIKRAKGS